MLNNSYKTKIKKINILNNKDRIIHNKTYRTLHERERERAETSKSKNKYNRNIYNKYGLIKILIKDQTVFALIILILSL